MLVLSSINNFSIENLHMMSCHNTGVPKIMKSPNQTKPILWELNSFLMKTLHFVLMSKNENSLKATSKNTIILFNMQVWVVLDVSLTLPMSFCSQHELHVLFFN